jgi:RHS repeat-associated protein
MSQVRSGLSVVSGAIGLGGGLSGSVNERTGLFSVSVPVAGVAGPGSAGVTWSLVWDQARAAGGLDRSGFGPGWSLGASFIDPAGAVTVYPANGGAYVAGGSYPSGLQNYPLQDLAYKRASGTLPAWAGLPATEYAFVLSYDNGRTDYFDGNGNLITRTDRFGNRTVLTWQSLVGGFWVPSSIVDGYGQATTFSYTQSSVVVSAPRRSDGVVACTTITLDAMHRVTSVTDPAGAAAHFAYAPVSGVELLTSVTSASQARTLITYQSIGYQPGLTAVQAAVTVDASGVLGPARLFSMDPEQNTERHNYTGYPRYNGGSSDRLFESGDENYFYTTSMTSCVIPQLPAPATCPDPRISTVSTYDSKHRLVGRTVLAGAVSVQHQTATYPPVQTAPVPGNYARPATTTLTYSATSGMDAIAAATGSRTVTTSRIYDDHGRVTQSTDETGTKPAITYDDRYGLITSVTITGTDGSCSQTTHVLSADKKTISSTTTAYAAPGQPLTARSTTSYSYDAYGQPAQRTMTWAPGAKPAGGGGPDTVTTMFATSVDLLAPTRTITTTTGAGTPVAASTTTVLDLVTGRPVRTIDPLGRITSYTYDAAGRRTGRTTPDGLTTKTSYAAATDATPATRTVSAPDGRVVQTTYDALGRIALVTDNVSNQAFTGSPTARTLSTYSYSLDGTTIAATDQQGRTITTTLDVLGRQVQQVGPTGITHAIGYNDVAHTTTQTIDAASSIIPDATRTTSYNDGNRPVSVQRQYSDGTADPTQMTGYDGLGRVTSQTSNDVTLHYTYLAAGGASTAQTATPQDTPAFPGDPLDLSGTVALGGQQTTSARKQPDQPASQGTRLTYDAAGRMATSTDPKGRTTRYTYHPDGTVATRTTPSGTVVTDSYDPVTGRLTSVTAQPSGGAAVTRTYGYVPAGQPGAGRVRTISDGTSTVTLGYDADGHVVSRSYSDGTATFAKYTDTGLLSTTTDVTGAVTSYGYDAAGRMTTAAQMRGTTVLASVTYTYDAMSRVKTTTRANGVTTTNTWTARNQLSSQRTTSGSGSLIEEHDYSYDSHGNVATRTDTCAAVSSTPATAGTWTTAYRYDAYNRLISSATYVGSSASGLAWTSTTYTVNVAGDVVGTTTTTRLPVDGQPPLSSRTTNTIDVAGQLTAQVTNGTTVEQAFDHDGRVMQSLTGSAMTYDAFDRMVTAARGETTATYTYWPDGTLRSTTTASAAGGTSTSTFHYGCDGTLVNDTTADPTTGAAATTASYLITAGREARTMQPGTTTVGTVPNGAPAPVVTGAGTGYLLRDRHSSVTALVDANGTVTNAYQYGDYGTPAQPDGQLRTQPAPNLAPGGRANPFQYTGAAPASSMTDATTGLLLLPARSYDPAQGRFTSRDTANVFNHYQGFSTNPIVLVDLTGHFSLADLLIDIGTAIVFGVAAVLTGGAALAAAPAIVGAEAAAVTTSAIVTTVATAVTAIASATGAVASAVKAADDIDDAVSGKHFLSTDQRSALGMVQMAAGVVATVTGIVAAVGAAGAVAEDAAQDAADFLRDPDEPDVPNAASKRYALVEGEEPDYTYLRPGEEIPPDPALSNETSDVTVSYVSKDAPSSIDSVVDGVSGRTAEPPPVTPSASRPIPIQRPVLRTWLGSRDLTATDSAVITSDRGLTASLNTDEEAFQSRIASLVPRATGTSPTLDATNGNWGVEAARTGMLNRGESNSIDAMLNRDDNYTFMRFPRGS